MTNYLINDPTKMEVITKIKILYDKISSLTKKYNSSNIEIIKC